MELSIKQWNEADFANAREIWTDLLSRSNGDPLFLSWEWQYTWWEIFSRIMPLELLLLAAYNSNNELVGIAPLFRSTVRIRNILTNKRIQFIGNCWRGPATIRTEHLDFIVKKDVHGTVIPRFVSYLLQNQEWDDLVLSDLMVGSLSYSALQDSDIKNQVYVRHAESYGSYYVETTGLFADYLAERGKNTRLQMYGRRKYLLSRGDVRVVAMCSKELDEYFAVLNCLHKKRWGSECYVGTRLEFNRRLAMRMADGEKLHLSVLYLNCTPLSALYNIRVRGHEYNIQGGFDESFDRKIAFGFLHLGYAIEQAFLTDNIKWFHLLAGGGKYTQYKERLTRRQYDIVDIQIIRGKALGAAYKLYDSFSNRFEERH